MSFHHSKSIFSSTVRWDALWPEISQVAQFHAGRSADDQAETSPHPEPDPDPADTCWRGDFDPQRHPFRHYPIWLGAPRTVEATQPPTQRLPRKPQGSDRRWPCCRLAAGFLATWYHYPHV